ncbi:MAG: site-specific integrase [Bacteroidetes bacterium]|nr:site-specific integrase [Bacteroidota bacterium]
MSVILRTKKLHGKNHKSMYALYLDFYESGNRRIETIPNLRLDKNDSKENQNKILEKGRQIARLREIALFDKEQGMPSLINQKMNFIDYFSHVMNGKEEIKTKETWNNTLNYLKTYFRKGISFDKLNEEHLTGFLSYIQNLKKEDGTKKLKNGTLITYFNKITTALNQAVKEKKIYRNPANNVQKIKKLETKKVFLSIEELQKIENTEFYNDEVKRAFLFSCWTGLRVSDVMKLKWGSIEEKKRKEKTITQVHIPQQKTSKFLYLTLNPVAVKLMGNKKNKSETVFKLPKHSRSINKALEKLIKKAGIEKKVTFHCGRHTNATQLVSAGVPIPAIQNMLGHRDIKSTMVYAKVVDEVMEKAAYSLPSIKLRKR